METKPKTRLSKFDADNPYAFWYILSIPASIYVVFFFISLWFWSSNQGAGTFGDTFGFVNALFGGLTLGGIYYTIQLQRKELRETREEFKTQSQIFQQQRFDEFFFYLLTLHRELRTELINSPHYGLGSIFNYHINLVEKQINQTMKREDQIKKIETATKKITANENVYHIYFTTFNNILDQIISKRDSIGFSEKEYMSTLISSINADEIKSLVLYSLTQPAFQKTFRDLGFHSKDIIEECYSSELIRKLFED